VGGSGTETRLILLLDLRHDEPEEPHPLLMVCTCVRVVIIS